MSWGVSRSHAARFARRNTLIASRFVTPSGRRAATTRVGGGACA
jgi:hypothetical protein